MTVKKRTAKDGPAVKGGSTEARRTAALILEVLAGVIRPSDASERLGVGTPRYYQLESRAVGGLIEACEPRPKGPGHNHERELNDLRKKLTRAENEVLRYQALARTAQRSIGLPVNRRETKRTTKGRKHRKPTVRAAKVIQTLRKPMEEEKSCDTASQSG